MEARDRSLSEWFNVIRTGRLRLPRFQRGEEWTHNEVESLLDSVLRELPAGAALVLEVGDEEPFISRTMAGAPEPTERAVEHLLDGQQRLTALWRALHDNYDRYSYFVRVPQDGEEPDAVVQPRWLNKRGQRTPLWADDAKELARRRLVPLRLLLPGDPGDDIRGWCDEAADGDVSVSRDLEVLIRDLRALVANYNIPFLSLPPRTPKDVALDVFIKLNTSLVRLTPYDIVVAQVEAATGQSLPDLVAQLHASVPDVEAYTDPSELILAVSALRQDHAPTQASFFKLDLEAIVGDWERTIAGVGWLVEVLTEEHIFDSMRLPTGAVLPVIAALHDHVPEALDGRGFARSLMRKYVWRASLSQRYSAAAATAALEDYRALKEALQREDLDAVVPLFNEDEFPIVTGFDELERLRWPKNRLIAARGVLNVALKAGAHDIADGSVATRVNLPNREYHHLFPDHLLKQTGGLDRYEIFRVLNCALITWQTNRNIGAKDPLDYLKERSTKSGLAADLGDELVRQRLATQLVPFDELSVGGYAAIADAAERSSQLRDDYMKFLRARAAMFTGPIAKLCRGDAWPS